MRISDWSSDVCSSDLSEAVDQHQFGIVERFDIDAVDVADRDAVAGGGVFAVDADAALSGDQISVAPGTQVIGDAVAGLHRRCRDRSEEHTSELQSLMRISYAVFCLKKKKQHTQ